MKIILCVTGSIAATEDLKLVHQLQRHGFDVECFMTDDAHHCLWNLQQRILL